MMIPRASKPEPLQLTPQLLVAAYCQGLFPMARSRREATVEWFSPDPRAVLPLDDFYCPRSLRQAVRRQELEVRRDTAFEQVIRACAEPRPGRTQTWINDSIRDAFIQLHRLGCAHSVEAWRDGRLVGGLYGVAIGGAFFGESMFHRAELGGRNASKVCLVHLVEHLRARGFALLDVQINSDHMRQFGTIDLPRADYLRQLDAALRLEANW